MAALRGKKPTTIEKRLKMFLYGNAGVGKTMLSLHFPAPYVIDTERGAVNDEYTQMIDKNNGAILNIFTFDEVYAEVLTLLSIKHDYKTLIIDPMTHLYDDLLVIGERKVGTEYGRHYSWANKEMKKLTVLLTRLDMNVIITSHAKNEYGGSMIVVGQTYDCYKKLDYPFDLVLELRCEDSKRFFIIKKTRIKKLPEGEVLPTSFDEIANRYGLDMIVKETVPVELATQEQVQQLTHLITILNVEEDVYEKWLKKAEASTFSEMCFEDIQKCIEFLKKKIEQQEPENLEIIIDKKKVKNMPSVISASEGE